MPVSRFALWDNYTLWRIRRYLSIYSIFHGLSMRIESSDFGIELAIKGADGNELGVVSVTASELIEHFVKADADAETATEQKRTPPYNRVEVFKSWLVSKAMPATISDELFGTLYIRTRAAIDPIQKKMLGTGIGEPN